jgi:hypothetical protein
LQVICGLGAAVLAGLNNRFSAFYPARCVPSIPAEILPWATLSRAFYSMSGCRFDGHHPEAEYAIRSNSIGLR